MVRNLFRTIKLFNLTSKIELLTSVVVETISFDFEIAEEKTSLWTRSIIFVRGRIHVCFFGGIMAFKQMKSCFRKILKKLFEFRRGMFQIICDFYKVKQILIN